MKVPTINNLRDNNMNRLYGGDICVFWDGALSDVAAYPSANSYTVEEYSHMDEQGKYITKDDYHFESCLRLELIFEEEQEK